MVSDNFRSRRPVDPRDAERRVIAIIARQMSMPESRIGSASLLAIDLGVAGDDALAIIGAIAKDFDLNCSTLDLSTVELSKYFGREGFSIFQLPFYLFKRCLGRQTNLVPVRVSDLVSSVLTGTWVTPVGNMAGNTTPET